MIEKIAAWVPVTDEDIVDSGTFDSATVRAAMARLARRRAEADARWRALPLRTRVYRTLRSRYLMARLWHRWTCD